MFPGFMTKSKMYKIQVVPGSTNQEDGEWSPPVETELEITGAIQNISLKDIQRMPEGKFTSGDRKLTSLRYYHISVGDKIRVMDDDFETAPTFIDPNLFEESVEVTVMYTEWVVVSQKSSHRVKFASINQDFETYFLKRSVNA